jgi:hypothetical protein
MQNISANESRRIFLPAGLIVLALIAAFIFAPDYFRSEAGQRKSAGEKAANREKRFENYDIRADKKESAAEAKALFRAQAGKDATVIADAKDEIASGEKALLEDVPTLKIEYSPVIFAPEVITPVVNLKQDYLTPASNEEHAEILRRFIVQNNKLFGLAVNQPAELTIAADYTNPDGNLSFARLEQKINDIPVFQGEVKAGFTKRGEMIRVINNLAPGLDAQSVSNNFGDPLDAVKYAAASVDHQLQESELTRNETASNDLKFVFGEGGDWMPTAEKIYFPVEPGVARAAWRVLLWQPKDAYYLIVDAETGRLLWRKNITSDQTQPATYNVYANSTSMLRVLDSPAAGTPGPSVPNGASGTFQNRTDVTLIGNEAPYAFNNLGWISDGINATEGNNVVAGLDRINPDGVDTTVTGSGSRVFSFNFNPGPGNPTPGDEPIQSLITPCASTTASELTDFQRGVVTQLFYITNRYHDEMYLLGFNEQSGNFQTNNFGRGGIGNDRVSAEAQDCSGASNANFSTPPDGFRGRMQMYIFTNPTPDRDGSLDADVVIHELTHGLSNRLHGNASGLSSNMSAGMGEGWSDFYALSLLSEPTDPLNGVYPAGAYSTNNSYYGIRRFPYAIRSSVGGANNRPHNPLTFADVDATQRDLNDGAFPPAFLGSSADQVHRMGEVWATTLWETRARFVNRLGWQEGNRRFLQIVTSGMKLAPLSPTFLQERDAIIAAARAGNNAAQDIADIWEGFRIRGMGFNAKVLVAGTGIGDTRVVESFDPPNVSLSSNTPISDVAPGGNGNGFFEPGETLTINVPISNNSGSTINNVTVSIVGGGTGDYGSIPDNQTVTRAINYVIPSSTACGVELTITINVSSSIGQYTETRSILTGQPVSAPLEKFDGVTAPALPNGWTSAQTGTGVNWVTTTSTADSAPNAAFIQNTGNAAGGSDLESLTITITSSAAILKFRHNFNTEGGWDGGVLEISINGGAYRDIMTAGGRFIEGGYNGALGINKNPLDGRAAWTGNSNGFISTSVRLPASANGQPVKFKWRFGQDDNTANIGWFIDTIDLVNSYSCGGATTRNRKTVGVFRPTNGITYMRNSNTGGFADIDMVYGVNGDTSFAGDWNGDKIDSIGIYRNGVFYLRNSNTTGPADIVFAFGAQGDQPVAGDWNGDGIDTIGVYRPTTGVFMLRNSNSAGAPDTVFVLGNPGDVAIAGDWNGDGVTTTGVFRPTNGIVYLKNANTTGDANIYLVYGVAGDKPVAGDWDGDGQDSIGIYREGVFYLRNSNTQGNADLVFALGNPGDEPIAGDWDGAP